MFAKLAAAAAVATATLAAPAFAVPQIERELGLPSGVYSTQQLLRLQSAVRSNDVVLQRQIHANPQGFSNKSADVLKTVTVPGFGSAELNAAERIFLERAVQERDEFAIRQILKGNIASEGKVGSGAGKAQLAASLGVNPDDYTLSELARINVNQRNAQGTERF